MALSILPPSGGPKPQRSATPAPGTKLEKPLPEATSLRGKAGAMAPSSLASSSAGTVVPQFEKRNIPAPEIPGLSDWVGKLTQDPRPPGLNAVTCKNDEEMGKVLRKLSQAGGPGQEGHVRVHMGVYEDTHRVAVSTRSTT